jgi:hypothetical protein
MPTRIRLLIIINCEYRCILKWQVATKQNVINVANFFLVYDNGEWILYVGKSIISYLLLLLVYSSMDFYILDILQDLLLNIFEVAKYDYIFRIYNLQV